MINNQLAEEQARFLKIVNNSEDWEDLDLSCKIANLPKSLVEEWLEDYSLFWEKLEDLKDEKKGNLIDLIKKGDMKANMKFLLIYGKDRGWGYPE